MMKDMVKFISSTFAQRASENYLQITLKMKDISVINCKDAAVVSKFAHRFLCMQVMLIFNTKVRHRNLRKHYHTDRKL